MSIQSKDIAKLAAEALEPFAKSADEHEAFGSERAIRSDAEISVGDLRRAREVHDLLTASPAIPTETGQGFSVPAGYKLVPLKASEAMIAAAAEADLSGSIADIYTAILSAIDIPAPAGGEEAVAFASAGQIATLADRLNDDGGAYIPLRKTPLGNFQMPLFAHPAPDHHLRVEVERLRAERDEARKDHEWMAEDRNKWQAAMMRERDRATTAETRITELKARILGAIDDARSGKPDDDETWESWFGAAFDLAAEKVALILDRMASPVFPSPKACSPTSLRRREREIYDGQPLFFAKKEVTEKQWTWLRSAASLDEGKAYSYDNEDHDALFDAGFIEAYPLNQGDWYGALVRVTEKGRAALEARARSALASSNKPVEEGR